MLPQISIFSSVPEILHPFTLEFHNKEIRDSFFQFKLSIQSLFVFSLIEIILGIVTSILTLIIYIQKSSSINNIILFVNFLALVFIILTIVFIGIGQKSKKSHQSLNRFVSIIQVICNKVFLYLILSIIKQNYSSVYESTMGFLWITEAFISCGYIVFIFNNFLIHFICHCFTTLFIFIIETFLLDKIQLSFIFLCSFYLSVFSVVFSYFHLKKQKITWYHFYHKTKEQDYYSEILSYDSLLSATFCKHKLTNFNKNLIKMLETTKYKSAIDKIELNNPGFALNNQLAPETLDELSLIIKRLLFTQIKIKNENLFFLVKEQLTALQNDENNFEKRIKGIFSIILENKELFRKIYYLGTINFDNSDQQYSVFIQVNSNKETITYIALGLDFPIVVSQNLEILNKISILNSKITHEIKNPLAAIQTLVQEIRTFTENTGVNEVINKLDTIYEYSEYMKFITKDFEFFAMKLNNLSEQKPITEIDIKRVSFKMTVDFSVDLIKHIWKNKNSKVLIKKEIDKNICEYINTDEIRFKQIIINLLSNSLKFTKMGSVTLSCENIDADYISIMVQDTGIGMKEEQVKALNKDDCLFLKSNSNNKMGSGLGLSIVKDMVKLLGKDFLVQSKYNEGTRLSFLLNKNINLCVKLDANNQCALISKENIARTDSQKHPVQNKISSKKLTYNNNNNNNISSSNIPLFMDEKPMLLEEKTKREEYVLLKPNELSNSVKEKIPNDTAIDIKQINSCFAPKRNSIHRKTILSFPKLNKLQLLKDNSNGEYSDSARVNRKKIYALVVEDEHVLRNCNINQITKYFSNKGVEISIDGNVDGIECIYKIYKGFTKEKKYQFIVTDELMNNMNGSMMTNIIRTLIDQQRFYPIKIYSSSGNNLVDDNFKKNYEGVFSKPLTIENVAQIFQENVEGNQ